MSAGEASVHAREVEANRARDRLAATVNALRDNLRPDQLADEAARGSGLDGWSAASVFDAATKRHPVPTALVAIGISLWAFTLLRRSAKNSGASGMRRSLRETVSALGQSATDVFRERAEQKRREFVGVANSHIESGLSSLADTIEKKLDDVIDVAPVASAARPLISSAIKVLLLGLVESMLAKA